MQFCKQVLRKEEHVLSQAQVHSLALLQVSWAVLVKDPTSLSIILSSKTVTWCFLTLVVC